MEQVETLIAAQIGDAFIILASWRTELWNIDDDVVVSFVRRCTFYQRFIIMKNDRCRNSVRSYDMYLLPNNICYLQKYNPDKMNGRCKESNLK